MGFHNPMTLCGQADRFNGEQVSEAVRMYNQAVSILDTKFRATYEEIESEFGDIVRIKPKTLLKLGRNDNNASGTPFTVSQFQSATQYREVYATGNTIDFVVSSSASDTETVTIEGHTLSGTDKTFVTQDVVLNGQTPVALTTPLNRATRIFAITETNLVGTVAVYDSTAAGGVTAGVPNTASATKVLIEAGRQQSQKGATSLSSVDYLIINQLFFSINAGNTGTVDFEIERRQFNNVFRPLTPTYTLRSGSNSSVQYDFNPPLVVPKNSDVRVNAVGSANNIAVTTGFNAYLALVQS